MRITTLKMNGFNNPIGYYADTVTLSWRVEDTCSTKQKGIRVKVATDKKLKDVIFDSGKIKDQDGRGYTLPTLPLKARTRYFYQVEVFGDKDKAKSDVAFFETSKLKEEWTAKWITPEAQDVHPKFVKKFALKGKPVSARLYICGLGLYKANVNGKSVTDDRFAPHFTDYNEWIQYQSYDVTESLKRGNNKIDVLLGNGWYKGVFGLNLTEGLYGKKFALLAELIVNYKDGSTEVISTDTEWECYKTSILDSSIYHGVVVDSRKSLKKQAVLPIDIGFDRLSDARSLPVVVKDTIVPEIITAANGDKLLDFKQNMVGVLRCRFNEESGKKIKINFGEVLQGGNFYNENYRTVRSEIIYTSNGKEVVFEPDFTFFGFRYAFVQGVTDLKAEDFTGLVLYSDFEERGSIETSNKKVNRVIKNAYWGIRGNSLDLPTDCPQRNERMGWTGDCQAISGTANRLFDMNAFYKKWLFELAVEQDADGCVYDVIPKIDYGGKGACAWGDAATVVPFNTYLATGDVSVLKSSYPSMKAWVDFLKSCDKNNENLRYAGEYRQYGDWLAIDNPRVAIDPDCPDGFTDFDYLCSVYFAYSAMLVGKSAEILGNNQDAEKYLQLSLDVKKAIYNKFLKVRKPECNTQTALVLAVALDIVPKNKKQEFVDLLYNKFKEDNFVLRTGFVGTIFVLKTLCENGLKDLAYSIFLSESYPGWLYAIDLGATTIWERWNSLMPDGTVNKGGMNSFNHYAFGMVVEWIYTYSAGIRAGIDGAGFKKFEIAPLPDKRLTSVSGRIMTAGGELASSYEYKGDVLEYNFTVPFDATATVRLDSVKLANLNKEDVEAFKIKETANGVTFKLVTGKYKFAVKL